VEEGMAPRTDRQIAQIRRRLDKYTSADYLAEFRTLQEKCVDEQGGIGTVLRHANALKYDMFDLSLYCHTHPNFFEESMQIFLIAPGLQSDDLLFQHPPVDPNIPKALPKFFPPTKEHRIGCIGVFATPELPVLLYETGVYECHPSIGHTLHDVVPLLRSWLTSILCPNNVHNTICVLLHPNDECICQMQARLNLPHIFER